MTAFFQLRCLAVRILKQLYYQPLKIIFIK